MKRSTIVLGIILVVMGCIILLKSFGILDFSWWALWKVWPFVFIFIGIAILPVNKGVKALLYMISIIACVALMVYESQNYDFKENIQDRLQKIFNKKNINELKIDMESDQISYFTFSDSITNMKVKAEFMSGDYVFDNNPDKESFRLSFHGANYKNSIKEKEATGFLNIMPKGRPSDHGSGKIFLDKKYFYTFDLQGEKTNLLLDASNIKMDTLYINAYQESTWDVSFSNLTPAVYVFIKTHPNVGRIDLKIPTESGYQFTSTMLTDSVKWNNRLPDTLSAYRSENFSTSFNKIFIDSNTRSVNVIQAKME